MGSVFLWLGPVRIELYLGFGWKDVGASFCCALLFCAGNFGGCFNCLLYWMPVFTGVAIKSHSTIFQSLPLGELWLANAFLAFLVARPIWRMMTVSNTLDF